jgi:DNA replication protein DnaC
MTEPAIYDVSTREGFLQRAAATTDHRIPVRFRDALATDPDVLAWCDAYASEPRRSLLILGPTGVGKTWQAFGALRVLAANGVPVRWEATTAPDLYARLRPRADADSEAEFRRFASAELLLIDDIGAAKASEWTEEVNYRLLNHRYNGALPVLLTSNLPAALQRDGRPSLAAALGERVMSRITGMCDYVVLKGTDRRRSES